MKSRLRRWRYTLLLLSFVHMFAPEPVFAQPTPSDEEQFQARVEAAAVALGNNPRFKNLSLEYRRGMAEFVAGNMLFVLLHEMAHAAISEMGLPVLGREEDAADSSAVWRLVRIGSGVSNRVLTEAAKGWFMADRRDQKEGDTVPYYDEHGLNQVRAYQIVCLTVGFNKETFKDLANETKLPEDRQDSCAKDYAKAANSWSLVLKPHLRDPDQPKTKIDVVYGEPTPGLEVAAQSFRTIQLLETVAEHSSNQWAWPAPFTLEMQSCGFVNARWVEATRKLTLCYELAHDFAELYREYGTVRADSAKRAVSPKGAENWKRKAKKAKK